MKGTISDFLALVAARPELSRDLVALAARHGFEFSSDELSDDDLSGVVGGTIPHPLDSMTEIGDDAQLANIDLQNMLQKQQQTLQMSTTISKALADTALAVIRKIG